MTAQWVWLGVWLMCCVMLGQWGDRVARAYAQALRAGARVDARTLASAAVRAVAGRRATAFSPQGLACAVVLTWAALPALADPSVFALVRIAACGVLLLLGLIDARSGYLPDALTLPLMWAGLLVAYAGQGVTLDDAVMGAASGYAALWGLDRVYRFLRGRPGLGGGDMKLVAAMGAWLGWAPLPHLVLLACVAGGVWVVACRRRRAWAAPLAFGPFLSAAAIVGLVGTPDVQWLF